MNCDDARPLIAGYVLEALDDDERDAVARHLEGCPECMRLAGALGAAAHQLPLALDTLEVPALPSSMLGRVERATTRPANGRTRRRLSLPLTPRARLVAALVAALAAVAVVAAVRSQQAAADEHELRARLIALVGQQSTIFDVVDSPHTTKALLLPGNDHSRAYGKIYTRSDSRTAVAFVNRLPAPAGSDRYLLWIRTGDVATRAGVFSLHGGFGYLVFRRPRGRVRDAFVTVQAPSTAAPGLVVLGIADRR